MKKIYSIFLYIFGGINIILLVVLIINMNKKYVGNVDNNFISFEMKHGYYLKENYNRNTTRFKLYDDLGSTIDIYILKQPYSNNNLYTKEEISRSINYQLLKEITNVKKQEFTYKNDTSYSKYIKENSIIEILVRYHDQSVLVLSYISSIKTYDNSLINDLNDKIIIK